jgi:hypothetical protein
MNETTLQTRAREDLWTACESGKLVGAHAALDSGALATQGRGGENGKSPLQMVAWQID